MVQLTSLTAPCMAACDQFAVQHSPALQAQPALTLAALSASLKSKASDGDASAAEAGAAAIRAHFDMLRQLLIRWRTAVAGPMVDLAGQAVRLLDTLTTVASKTDVSQRLHTTDAILCIHNLLRTTKSVNGTCAHCLQGSGIQWVPTMGALQKWTTSAPTLADALYVLCCLIVFGLYVFVT